VLSRHNKLATNSFSWKPLLSLAIANVTMAATMTSQKAFLGNGLQTQQPK